MIWWTFAYTYMMFMWYIILHKNQHVVDEKYRTVAVAGATILWPIFMAFAIYIKFRYRKVDSS